MGVQEYRPTGGGTSTEQEELNVEAVESPESAATLAELDEAINQAQARRRVQQRTRRVSCCMSEDYWEDENGDEVD